MSPLMISVVAFVAVTAFVGLLALVLTSQNGPRAADRLDTLTGKRKKDDEKASILRKSAFEHDKNSVLDLLTPNFLSLNRVFIQADCNIKPATLVIIGLLLGLLGSTVSILATGKWFFAVALGPIMFSVPFLWLLNKRRSGPKGLPPPPSAPPAPVASA